MNEFLDTPMTPFVRYVIAGLALAALVIICISFEQLSKHRKGDRLHDL